ncbi:MAG: exo-alpha-sialidase, partial [Phycisphaerae bacterium]|nr:exo-alpha-sialidase [Phycisphaerae bacterium]
VNKNYDDPGPWRQVAALKFSNDQGRTWGDCTEVACDPTLAVRYWDQRHAVSPDGTCVAMFWTYDHVNQKDLTITSSRSYDAGRTWEPPGDTRIIGAQACPAFLPDGRMVIAYIDRWNTRAIRVAISNDLGRTFEMFDRPLYEQHAGRVDPGQEAATSEQALQDQQLWTFGCQSLESTQAGDVWATYYAGDSASTNIHWAQLRF